MIYGTIQCIFVKTSKFEGLIILPMEHYNFLRINIVSETTYIQQLKNRRSVHKSTQTK